MKKNKNQKTIDEQTNFIKEIIRYRLSDIEEKIYCDKMLNSFISNALFNALVFENDDSLNFEEIKHVDNLSTHETQYTMKRLIKYHDYIVSSVVINCLLSKALLEKGREFSIEDTGIHYSGPSVSDLLMQQAEMEKYMLDRKIDLHRSR